MRGKSKAGMGLYTYTDKTQTPRTVSRVFFLLVLLLFEIMKTTLTLSHIAISTSALKGKKVT